ncbi:Transmembrane protein 41A [Phytophthora pseudosyringae]|uniref:Transmembrane protein 41A n=1 Tax=Phytophthora pseudosyringae TaxID=221518 RepID=A0A8T1VXU0_9STRA|nr:Transmembrane protein 41A [Phytophthora pseudosyringae]
MPVAPARVGGSRALLRLVAKLVLIFGCAVGVVLGLCALLVRRVREHDAALGLATSKLDTLSVRSLSSLQELQRSHETFLHVFAVHFPLALTCFTCVYVLKQVENHTFAIPGSALLNVFAGAILPLSLAFPLACALTAFGASCCFLLSKNLASEEIVLSLSERVLPGKLHTLRHKIEDARERGQLPFLLLFLRVFPFTPNWFLNMASPWLQVPLRLFAPSVALGLLPYNFITVHAGAMLSSLRSTSDLLDPRTMGFLVLLAVGMLIPALLKKKANVKSTAGQEPAIDLAPDNRKKMD